jgi:hypothetical protein
MISQEPLGQGFGGDDEVDPQSQGYDCYQASCRLQTCRTRCSIGRLPKVEL